MEFLQRLVKACQASRLTIINNLSGCQMGAEAAYLGPQLAYLAAKSAYLAAEASYLVALGVAVRML
jgi:hypothetical protein